MPRPCQICGKPAVYKRKQFGGKLKGRDDHDTCGRCASLMLLRERVAQRGPAVAEVAVTACVRCGLPGAHGETRDGCLEASRLKGAAEVRKSAPALPMAWTQAAVNTWMLRYEAWLAGKG